MRLSSRYRIGQFPIAPAPILSALNNSLGDTKGRNTVLIDGLNLSGPTNVFFGAVAATSFVQVSSTRVSAIAPANATGNQPITVSTMGGTSNPLPYEFWDPSIPGNVTLLATTPDYKVTAGLGKWTSRINVGGAALELQGTIANSPAEGPAGTVHLVPTAVERLTTSDNLNTLIGNSGIAPFEYFMVVDLDGLPAAGGFAIPFADDNGVTGYFVPQWDSTGLLYGYYNDSGSSVFANAVAGTIKVGRNVIRYTRTPAGARGNLQGVANGVATNIVSVGNLGGSGNMYVGTPAYGGNIYRTNGRMIAIGTAQRNWTAGEIAKFNQWAASLV